MIVKCIYFIIIYSWISFKLQNGGNLSKIPVLLPCIKYIIWLWLKHRDEKNISSFQSVRRPIWAFKGICFWIKQCISVFLYLHKKELLDSHKSWSKCLWILWIVLMIIIILSFSVKWLMLCVQCLTFSLLPTVFRTSSHSCPWQR